MQTLTEFRHLPGPRGYPLIGNLHQIARDPIRFWQECALQYGDYVRLHVGLMPVLMITRPEDVRYVMQENLKNFPKESKSYDSLRALLGNGLIFNRGGEFWRRQRRLTQPAFHLESIRRFVSVFNRSSSLMIERWKAAEARGEPIDAMREMMKTTLQVVGQALLSKDLLEDSGGVADALTVILDETNKRVNSLSQIGTRLPTARNRKVREAKRVLDELVYRLIAERRRDPLARHRDLLQMYMMAVDEETGTGMTDVQIHDEVMSIFLAGHETTANALSWLWYLLGQNADAERELRAEVDAVLGGREPELEDFARLKQVECAFLESLRLYPPVWMMVRRNVEDDQIGPVRIPGGTTVLFSPFVIQRLERYWREPESFDPGRFMGEGQGQARAMKFDYFPFAGGPRVCIGQRFAILEAQTIVARVLQAFELRRVEEGEVLPYPSVTLRPGSAIRLRVRSR